jgi:hypothetical protein
MINKHTHTHTHIANFGFGGKLTVFFFLPRMTPLKQTKKTKQNKTNNEKPAQTHIHTSRSQIFVLVES